MTAVSTVRGPAAWLRQVNIDTDVIIRIERLTEGGLSQVGRYAFEALRYNPDGSENPEFVLNQPGYRGAPILIAGANFGCGSSREPAVDAIRAMGIRVVIAPSFGDIFYSNCFQGGLLPIQLDEAVVTSLGQQAAASLAEFVVDLEATLVVPAEGKPVRFEIDGHRRTMLLEGLDEIQVTLKDAAAIREWQRRDRGSRPWMWERLGKGAGA